MESKEDIWNLSKSWQRAMEVRNNTYSSSMKQCTNKLCYDYNRFLRQQDAQKKKLFDDLKKRQAVLQLRRKEEEKIFGRRKPLSKSKESLRKDNQFARGAILERGRSIDTCQNDESNQEADSESLEMTGRIRKSRTYSRSAEDLQALFDNARRKRDEKRWKIETLFRLPKLQPLPPIYTSGSQFTSSNNPPSQMSEEEGQNFGVLPPVSDNKNRKLSK